MAKAAEINIKINDMVQQLRTNFDKGGTADLGEKGNFYWWFEEYIKHVKLKNGYHHHKKMSNVYAKIKAFKSELPVKGLTNKFLQDFEASLIKEGSHTNYIADIMARIRSVVKAVVADGALEYHKNPFLHFKIRTSKVDRERLEFSDILKLENVKLKGDEDLARDIYISSFYCGGIRWGDACRINKSNFKEGRIVYQMNKTTTVKNIKLSKTAARIFKKWGYKFPLNIDWKHPEKSIDREGSRMRKHLKAACEKAGVKEVTFHTSRHSIADYAVKNKLTEKQTQGILGHKQSATTAKYLRSFYQEETDEGIDKLFNT